MSTIELTRESFESTVIAGGTILIDFWAEWCGPCRMFGPIYDTVSNDYPDVIFGKVDTEAQQELAGMFNIQSIPTLMIIRDQVVVFSQAGALPDASLRDLINQALALDMDAVRADIAVANDAD
jgi:thioredoxin 1